MFSVGKTEIDSLDRIRKAVVGAVMLLAMMRDALRMPVQSRDERHWYLDLS